ncbi:fungal-specific transcription factor domain-containing protein [Rhizoctonia solani]|nr:fungal-specific transcription factor domain-containing protein [Rhizoctonia solani]
MVFTDYPNNPNFEWTSQDHLEPLRSVIPKSIPPDPVVVRNALPFIYSQYSRMVKRMAFRDPPPSVMAGLMQRLSISATTFSLMTLGARIIQSIIDATDKTDWGTYEKPIDNLHWQTCYTPEEGSSLICTKGRLTAAIELTAYKIFISNSASGYSFLRRAVPLATRVAYNYPQIWTKRGKISTQELLSLDVVELCSFLWMDTMTSTLLGTTPLLCYDTAPRDKLRLRHAIEWVNGCPQEFISWFARLNAARSTTTRHGNNPLLTDWERVEKEIHEWEPLIDRTGSSRDNITRLAVIEGWRNALLIYLYVGICGVTSVDPRVQFSVKQIIRLSQVAKLEVTYERHLFGPAILAGACARLESQRKSILRIVSFQRCSRIWVLQISDFVSILQHLWRGAATGGEPIIWDDYIRSRRAVLPIYEQ